MPYRLLWHAYCLTELSSEANDRLVITSKNGVKPESFVFGPVDGDGNFPVQCDSHGVSRVRWIPEFERLNTMIVVNQPKGSMNLTFRWNFTYNSSFSLGLNLAVYGRRYTESIYHWLILEDEFPEIMGR